MIASLEDVSSGDPLVGGVVEVEGPSPSSGEALESWFVLFVDEAQRRWDVEEQRPCVRPRRSQTVPSCFIVCTHHK